MTVQAKWVTLIVAVFAGNAVVCVDQRRARACVSDGTFTTSRQELPFDPLPLGAIARLGTWPLRMGSRVESISCLPGGTLLIARSNSSGISVWDTRSGKLVRHFESATGYAFSGDGKLVSLSFGNDLLHLQETLTGRVLQKMPLQNGPVNGVVALSFDGTTLSWVEKSRAIRIVDRVTGKLIRRIEEPLGPLSAAFLAFTPDGKGLVVGGQHIPGGLSQVSVRDTRTGAEVFQQEIYPQEVSCIALSVDGTLLGCNGTDGQFRIWNLGERKECLRIETQRASTAVAFSPLGDTIALSDPQGIVRIRSVGSGRLLRQLSCGAGTNFALSFSADGKLLAVGGENHLVRLFEVATGNECFRGVGHQGSVRTIAFTFGETVVATGGWDGVIRLWNPFTGKLVRKMETQSGEILSLAFSPTDRLLACLNRDGVVRVFNPVTGQREGERKGSMGAYIKSLLFLSDKSMLTAQLKEKELLIADVLAGRLLHRLGYDSGSPLWATFSPGGRLLAWDNDDGSIRIVDVLQGKPRLTFNSTPIGSGKDNVALCAPLFTSDGKTLLVKDETTGVRLVEVATGADRCRLQFPSESITCLGISPNGCLIAFGEMDGSIGLADAITGKQLVRVRGHQGSVEAVTFSSSGKLLASASADTTALVWDVELLTVRQHTVFRPLTEAQLQSAWIRLAEKDPRKAHAAIMQLRESAPVAVQWLRLHLRPAKAPVSSEQMKVLITSLDDQRFAARENANRELEKLGQWAKPYLLDTLASFPSLELRRRIEILLATIDAKPLTSEQVREVRCIEILEAIATPEARKLLRDLARGDRAGILTQESLATLDRLQKW